MHAKETESVKLFDLLSEMIDLRASKMRLMSEVLNCYSKQESFCSRRFL